MATKTWTEQGYKHAISSVAVTLPWPNSRWKDSQALEIAVYEWARQILVEFQSRRSSIPQIVSRSYVDLLISNPIAIGSLVAIRLEEDESELSWRVVEVQMGHSHRDCEKEDWKGKTMLRVLEHLTRLLRGDNTQGAPDETVAISNKRQSSTSNIASRKRQNRFTSILFPPPRSLRNEIRQLLATNPLPGLPESTFAFTNSVLATIRIHAYAASKGIKLYRMPGNNIEDKASFRCREGETGRGIPEELRCQYRINLKLEKGSWYIVESDVQHSHDVSQHTPILPRVKQSYKDLPIVEDEEDVEVVPSEVEDQHDDELGEEYRGDEEELVIVRKIARPRRSKKRSEMAQATPSTSQTSISATPGHFSPLQYPKSPLLAPVDETDTKPDVFLANTEHSPAQTSASYHLALVDQASSFVLPTGGRNDFASVLGTLFKRQGADQLLDMIPFMMANGINSIDVLINVLVASPSIFEGIMEDIKMEDDPDRYGGRRGVELNAFRNMIWGDKIYSPAQRYAL